MTSVGRIMALDYGTKRIGVALSDQLLIIAKPYSVIKAAGGKKDFVTIRSLIDEHQVQKLLIGLPTGGHGEIGSQASLVLTWSQKLAPFARVPIVLWDESHSTESASTLLRRNKSKFKQHNDAVAAAFILQEYLDALAVSHEEPGSLLESF